MDIFDDVKTIFKDTDLDIVDEDVSDELYNRKKEILRNYVIRAVPKNENKFMFFLRVDYEKFEYERSLIYKRTFRGKDIYYDTKLKKEVHRDNSGYVLALAEWLKRRKIIPTSGWFESRDKSCCRHRKIKVPDNMGVVSRYIEYQTRIGKNSWGESKFILVSIDGQIILKPKRKGKLIRILVKSGANKHKLAKYFKLSYRQVAHITQGIKQKKFKPESGKGC
jgi:hypothetical protein